MTPVVLDVVVDLPPDLRAKYIILADRITDRMRRKGQSTYFRLGRPYPSGAGGPCEPHVSIFMLVVPPHEIASVVRATREVAAGQQVLEAEGHECQHNSFGAPEIYFRKTPSWIALQQAVIASVEPLRRGRLRTLDPAARRIRELIDDPATDSQQRNQLLRFGYDEITEYGTRSGGPNDRFNPHVTLAWPVDPAFRVDLTGLPPVQDFSGSLRELSVFGMSPYGTCTTRYGRAPLGTGLGGLVHDPILTQ